MKLKKISFSFLQEYIFFSKITYIITFSAIWRQSHRGKYFPRPGKVGLRALLARQFCLRCIINKCIHFFLKLFYLLVRYSSSSPPPQYTVKTRVWRPCNFTPQHSLTDPVGQPFSFHLGDQQFASWGCTNSQWNRVSPVSDVSLHWWPRGDWSLALP